MAIPVAICFVETAFLASMPILTRAGPIVAWYNTVLGQLLQTGNDVMNPVWDKCVHVLTGNGIVHSDSKQ